MLTVIVIDYLDFVVLFHTGLGIVLLQCTTTAFYPDSIGMRSGVVG